MILIRVEGLSIVPVLTLWLAGRKYPDSGQVVEPWLVFQV